MISICFLHTGGTPSKQLVSLLMTTWMWWVTSVGEEMARARPGSSGSSLLVQIFLNNFILPKSQENIITTTNMTILIKFTIIVSHRMFLP